MQNLLSWYVRGCYSLHRFTPPPPVVLGCLHGRPVPCEGNVAASVGALSPVKETWLPQWAPCPPEGNMAATAGGDVHLTSQLATSTHTNICRKELILIKYQWPSNPAWGCTFTPCKVYMDFVSTSWMVKIWIVRRLARSMISKSVPQPHRSMWWVLTYLETNFCWSWARLTGSVHGSMWKVGAP